MNEIRKTRINRASKIILILSAILGVASIVLEYGFLVDKSEARYLHIISISVVTVFIIYQFLQLYIAKSRSTYLKVHKVEFAIIAFLVVEFVLLQFNLSIIQRIGEAFHIKDLTFLYIVFAQIYIIVGLVLSGLRYNIKVLQSKIHPSRIFVLSFMLTILAGTFLLMLPASTVRGSISFVDALFTSTSAVCVTGLAAVDTATYFTRFGQIVIMALFQIGGLGLMTFTTFFALFLSGGIGIRERIFLHDLLDEENIGAITRVLAYLLVTTFVIELIGAAILFQSIYTKFSSPYEAAFNSVFHSISAFCNAGFSIFSLNLMDPMVKNNYLFTTTISLLIILGGLGFPTILGLFKSANLTGFFKKVQIKVPLQSKMIIWGTLALIVFGAVITYLLEYNNALKGLSEFGKWQSAYFQSVTARTAGFNTFDFGIIHTSTSILYFFLMFVGASPGGTGGGIKTTTFIIIIASVWSIVREQKQVRIGNRSISNDVVTKALLKLFLTIFIITAGIFVLSISEGKSLLDLSFEAFSAFGTVGLSRGITGSLTSVGKLTIVLLMFIGRIGPLAFIYSIIRTQEKFAYDLPGENISIL